ncbi:MAG: glycosyltransferase family 2 protein [Candidatus Aenigmatarchaeota archaeon]
MKEPLVSVIIINYNGLKHLNECLSTLKKTKYKNFETILIDNNSSDGSVEFVEKKFKWVKVIKLKENFGVAFASNIGIENAKGKYVVFLNNDISLDPLWLKEMVKVIEKNPEIGACTSKLLLYSNPKLLNAAGIDVDFYGFPACRGLKHRGCYETDKNQYKIGEVFSGHGASMLIRKDVLEKIGKFNSDYGMHYEDIDVCWKIRLAGYKILYVPSSVVLHKIRGSSSFFSIEGKFFLERNRLRTLLQNYELTTLIRILPFYVFLKSLEVWFYIFFGKPRFSLQIVKSFLYCLINVPKISKDRKFVQRKVRKIKDKHLMKHMKPYSIELSLFLEGAWKAIV